MHGRKIGVAMGIVKNRRRRLKALIMHSISKGWHKTYFIFYASRLQAVFARSEAAKSSKQNVIPTVSQPQIEQIQPKSWRLNVK